MNGVPQAGKKAAINEVLPIGNTVTDTTSLHFAVIYLRHNKLSN